MCDHCRKANLNQIPAVTHLDKGSVMEREKNKADNLVASNNIETEKYSRMGKAKNGWNAFWKNDVRGRKRSLFARLSLAAPWLIPYSSPFNYLLKSWLEEHITISNMRILEIGGTGSLGLVLGKAAKEYVLIDYSEEAIERAKHVMRRVPNASCKLVDMFDYQPPELSELVVSMGLIEHFNKDEKEKCIQAHMRLSHRYVCIGAPSDSPINWWNHFRFERTKEYPSQRPVSERELFDLCMEANLFPLAMTRLDSGYGYKKGMLRAFFRRFIAARWPFKGWGKNRIDGGIVVVLAERTKE